VKITRRLATTADTDSARRIHHAAVRSVVERQFGTWDQLRQDSFFAADWASAVFEVILVDGAMAGYCAGFQVVGATTTHVLFEWQPAPAPVDRPTV